MAPIEPQTEQRQVAVIDCTTPAMSISGDGNASSPPGRPVPAKVVEEGVTNEETRVTGIETWLEQHNLNTSSVYVMAARVLQGALAHSKSKLAAVGAQLSNRPDPIRIVFLDHELAFSKKIALSAWQDVIQASKSFALQLDKNEQKPYREAIKVTEEIITSRKGAKSTFLFGFLDRIENKTERQQDRTIRTVIYHYVVGMAAYLEPRPLMRGAAVEAMTVEQFNYFFTSQGGKLTVVDPPKRIHERIGIAMKYAENYLEANHTESINNDAE